MGVFRPAVSLIIPAYNEAGRIGTGLRAIAAFAEARRLPLEVIVVDDGSRDGTADVAEAHFSASAYVSGRVIRLAQNRGKGYAVRTGLKAARAPYAMFSDADLSTPVEEMPRLLACLDDGADVAFGSRALDRSLIGVHQSRPRELGGRAFNLVLRLATGLPFKDTQCGFKAFRMSVCRPLVEAGTIEGFGFDIELLYEAHRAGLRMREVAVRWDHREGSKVRLLRDGARMLRDVFTVRLRGAGGAYDRGIHLSGVAARRDAMSRVRSAPSNVPA